MDNNPTPTSQVDPALAQPSSGGKSKTGLWLIVGLLVVILAIAGAYWYLNKQQAPAPTAAPGTTGQTSPSSSQSLDEDLNSIDVAASDSTDFQEVDAGIQSL